MEEKKNQRRKTKQAKCNIWRGSYIGDFNDGVIGYVKNQPRCIWAISK